ncbi:hypothetical protein GIB67_009662 [Kingdonia uniflora]|uniref:CSN8/PSMD8/EIF3K domain-containing protein n=1 Tax=Kingdonia uniflora TaxID=39325 RepID=A0A7J7LB03_9MAGN|nr:hypothetical protein GIB67_009662 [Kingdonia uniflora]
MLPKQLQHFKFEPNKANASMSTPTIVTNPRATQQWIQEIYAPSGAPPRKLSFGYEQMHIWELGGSKFLQQVCKFEILGLYYTYFVRLLIPQQMEEQFKALVVLSHYLETARFRQFWEEAAKNRSILDVVPGFEQAIQAYVIHVLSLTYQKIPRAVLAEALNIEGPTLDKFVEHQSASCGWVLEKGQEGRGQLIVPPRSEFNQPELKKNTADSIPLEHITRIFPVLS